MEIIGNSIPSLALIHFIIQNSSRSKDMNKTNDPHVFNETSAIMVWFCFIKFSKYFFIFPIN